MSQMLVALIDIGIFIQEITYLHISLNLAKLTHNVTTDHTPDTSFNTVLPY
jgi:hypothetical protein